jgi:hypothetical protein
MGYVGIAMATKRSLSPRLMGCGTETGAIEGEDLRSCVYDGGFTRCWHKRCYYYYWMEKQR